jgi:hypothetical protein
MPMQRTGEPDEDPAEVEAAWAAEIERRIEENAPGIPADIVFAEGRAPSSMPPPNDMIRSGPGAASASMPPSSVQST